MTEHASRPDQPERMCPSTPRSNATVFLGMITPAGRVAYVTPPMPADLVPDSADDACGPAESRYRFAGPCVTSSCGFWTGDHCGLGAKLAESYEAVLPATTQAGDASTDEPAGLPRCAIRRSCRWYAEQGPRACVACSYVVTDAR